METMIQGPQTDATLDTLLKAETLPYVQGLRYALQLAVALRTRHQRGKICGGLHPSQIRFGNGEAAIDPRRPRLTTYTAPEILEGGKPDVRTDVFAFGCIVRQMLFREPACNRELETLLGPSQFGALQSMIAQCTEANPSHRPQGMLAVCMELELLNTTVGQHQSAAPAPRPTEDLGQKLDRMEAELRARTVEFDQRIVLLQHLITGTREQVAGAVLSFKNRLRTHAEAVEIIQASVARKDALMERVVDSIAGCEEALVEMQRASQESREEVEHSMATLEDRLLPHAEAIGALQANAVRTEDLLEGMVESIDSLQSFVLERTSELASA